MTKKERDRFRKFRKANRKTHTYTGVHTHVEGKLICHFKVAGEVVSVEI